MRHFAGCLLGIVFVALVVGMSLHVAFPPSITFAIGVAALLAALMFNALAHWDTISSARDQRFAKWVAGWGDAGQPGPRPVHPRERTIQAALNPGPEDFPDLATHSRRAEIEDLWARGRKGRAVELFRSQAHISSVEAMEQILAAERWRSGEGTSEDLRRICIDCREENPADAETCAACGGERLETLNPLALELHLPLSGTTPEGGSEARRCLECGQYNWPDSKECSWCLGEQLGPVHRRASEFWAPTSWGGMIIYLVMLGGALLAAMGALCVIPQIVGGADAQMRTLQAVRPVTGAMALGVYVAGIILIPLVAALWRQAYAVFPRHEDLVQVVFASFVAMLVGVAVGWLMLG